MFGAALGNLKFEYANLLMQGSLFCSAVLIILLIAACMYIIRMRSNLMRLEFSNHAKTTFVKKLSYELKSPISGILGYAEMLESGFFGNLNIAQRERVADMKMCGHRINEVLEDFIGIAVRDLSKALIRNEQFDLKDIIDKAALSLSHKIHANHINLVIHFQEGSNIISSDSSKLYTVVKNLLDNAVKFSSKGGQVTVRCEKQDNTCKIQIADAGIGFDKVLLDRVMKFPSDHITKEFTLSSLYLGLPIAHYLIKQLGGSLKMESKKNFGTTAEIIIPVKL